VNGLTLLGVLLTFGLMTWAAWSLVYGGTRKPYPEQVERKMDRWGDR
jgi:hypothetical protein